jgi:hypothetical protein
MVRNKQLAYILVESRDSYEKEGQEGSGLQQTVALTSSLALGAR